MSKKNIEIRQNVLLSDFTTFRVGGPARWFCMAKTIKDIKSALNFAREKNIDYFILAGGSNLIVSDEGYKGLIIKIEFENLKIKSSRIKAGSGYILDKLVDIADKKGLKGLEWAGGLPGTIGGAVRGNAGAFNGEIKDIVSSVRSLKLSSNNYELSTKNNTECQFGYRESIFKYNNEIILEVELQMDKGDPKLLKEKSEYTRKYRKEKHPIEFPCAGSIFKNIPVKSCTYEVQERFKDVIKTDPFPVIPTAAILADAGLKGFQIGEAQISEKHPNYIINLGNSKAQSIVAVIEHVVATVKEKYNITLEVEPQLLGFDKKFE